MKKLILRIEKILKLIFILLGLFLFSSVSSKNEKIEFLMKGNEYTLSLLKSGIIECECNTEFSDKFLKEREDPPEKYEIIGMFKDEKYFQDMVTTHAKSKRKFRRIIAYNGEYTSMIDMEINDSGQEINKTGANYPWKETFLPYVYSMINLLPQLFEKSTNRKLGREKIIDEDKCYEIEFEDLNLLRKIYLDVDKGYLIKKVIFINKKTDGKKSEYVVKRFKKFNKEIWFPLEIERIFYEKEEVIQRDNIIVKKFIPNPKIDETIFTLKFPKGLLIWDGTTKTSFFAP